MFENSIQSYFGSYKTQKLVGGLNGMVTASTLRNTPHPQSISFTSNAIISTDLHDGV